MEQICICGASKLYMPSFFPHPTHYVEHMYPHNFPVFQYCIVGLRRESCEAKGLSTIVLDCLLPSLNNVVVSFYPMKILGYYMTSVIQKTPLEVFTSYKRRFTDTFFVENFKAVTVLMS